MKSVQAQLHDTMQTPDMFRDTLLQAQSVQHGVKIGTAVRWQGGEFHQGDIVLLKNPVAAGVVELAANCGDRFLLYMTPLRLVRQGSITSSWCRSSSEPEVHEMTPTRHLHLATAWYYNSERTITVVE